MSGTRDALYSWLTSRLKEKGWQFARSGSKVKELAGKRSLDLATGFWGDANYNVSKPPRWLIQFDVRDAPTITASLPDENGATRIGIANAAQANVVGIAVRVVPILQVGDGEYDTVEDWEWALLFLLPYPVEKGSSSEVFSYDPESGQLTYKENSIDYVFAGLLGLRMPADSVSIANADITYAQLTQSLCAFLHVAPLGTDLAGIEFYDLSQPDGPDNTTLRTDIREALDDAPSAPPPEAPEDAEEVPEDDAPEEVLVEIPSNPDLLGIAPEVYRQINAALKSGKQHLMFYGPPGTGKTTLAKWVATALAGSKWTLVTGSADWSSQDIIGGYQPVGEGKVAFIPGVLLKNFDQPFIIDELNRCDIDKVLGPLFTVLSDQHTSLPYRVDIAKADSQPYVIFPNPKPEKEEHEFAPGERWRLIATINSIDKASLYQMSYALSRRFGWVFVDAPGDKVAFIMEYMKNAHNIIAPEDAACPLAQVWESVNEKRVLGPAPIIDSIRAILAMDENASIFGAPDDSMRTHLLDAFDMMVLPLLDGILQHDASDLATKICAHLGMAEASEGGRRISARLSGVAV